MKFKSVLYIDPKEQPENISVLLKEVHIPPIVQGYADRQKKPSERPMKVMHRLDVIKKELKGYFLNETDPNFDT